MDRFHSSFIFLDLEWRDFRCVKSMEFVVLNLVCTLEFVG